MICYSLLTVMANDEIDIEYDEELDPSNEDSQSGGFGNGVETRITLTEDKDEGMNGEHTNNATSELPKGGNSSDIDDEDYDYDLDFAHNFYNWAELVPTLIVYGATMVVGIAGNSLIIFTICRYRRMKSTTNVFLASLASADLLLIIICIPVKVT